MAEPSTAVEIEPGTVSDRAGGGFDMELDTPSQPGYRVQVLIDVGHYLSGAARDVVKVAAIAAQPSPLVYAQPVMTTRAWL
jgi:hypothetical protein